ncbi:DHS-like NAD/FAD-binding domain-containing protein [Thelonectria olida]|uniref:protein acetyllysine N-acetyltransferase n=1 Tax=Thelonectria olida TaxID=1576542 RepID=A0A9P8VZR9_9HYPO|nr:DHS-like NAD/FAD-binding domain-containing protein [Thelonectria olida]
MANTAPVVAEREIHDAPDALTQKATKLAKLIHESKHFIVFTGAGISTSAGIPDFRGPEGVWTRRAQGRQPTGGISTLQAIPTPTHMALLQLQNSGILKYTISQNCDGLHRRSGILPDNISELHGNNNREYCKDCGKEFIRDFRAVATYEKTVHDHRTGRKCTVCGGDLHDSIINFGESLPGIPLKRAFEHAETADLCLVLGSSCTVTPANEIPEIVGARRKAKLAICNLQKTPLDRMSAVRIHSETDTLMTKIMEILELPIPKFILQRRLLIKINSQDDSRHEIIVSGVDIDETPVTFLRSVKLENNRRLVRSEPFNIGFRGDLDAGTEFRFQLEFMGNYGEPILDLVHEYNDETDAQALYILDYDPQTGEWTQSQQGRIDISSLSI